MQLGKLGRNEPLHDESMSARLNAIRSLPRFAGETKLTFCVYGGGDHDRSVGIEEKPMNLADVAEGIGVVIESLLQSNERELDGRRALKAKRTKGRLEI